MNLGLVITIALMFASCKDDTQPLPDEGRSGADKCLKLETVVWQGENPIGSTIYRYDENDRVEVEITVDGDDVRTDSVHYTYNSDGQVVRRYSYNITNGFQQAHTYEYDQSGNLIVQEYTINRLIASRLELYRGDNDQLDSVYVIANGNLTKNYYIYENDTLRAISEYDGSGNFLTQRVYTYTSHSTEMKTLNPMDAVTGRIVTLYDDEGREVEWKSYNEMGEMTNARFTEYDNKGNIIKVINEYVGLGTYIYETAWSCAK